MTESDARKLGWRLVRGLYQGTTEPRHDRWYWDRIDSTRRDNRSEGFATKREALQYFEAASQSHSEPLSAAGLQTWREQAGYSQRGLASLLGVDVMTVSRWERGERAIPPFLHLALQSLAAA